MLNLILNIILFFVFMDSKYTIIDNRLLESFKKSTFMDTKKLM